MLRKKKWWALTLVLWLTIIFVATQLPYFKGENTAEAIRKTVTSEHKPVIDDVEVDELNLMVRKATHIVVFGILSILFFQLLCTFHFAYILSWSLTTAYAMTDEWHQSFMPGRVSSIHDVMFDSLGAFLALSVVFFIQKKQRRYQ